MPVVKNPGVRLRLIDECLQRRHKQWTAELLYATVGEKLFQETGRTFSMSQFNLDIKALKVDYQAPLVNDRERGYYYTEPGFSIVKSPLVSEDAAVLRQVLAALRQFQGLGLSEELDEVVQRVEAHLQTVPGPEAARQVIWFEQVPDYVGGPFLAPLHRAIRTQQVLRLTYQPFGAPEAQVETVHPQHLKEFNRRWFLLATSNARPGISHFALDRIVVAQPEQGAKYVWADLHPEEYFRDVVGASIPLDVLPQEVRVRFRRGRGQYVRTKALHPSQEIMAEHCDELELRLFVRPNRELETLLLGFGEDAEVLAPATLRTRLQERLRSAAANYA
ncbi:MAG: WYL domain-containing protein [Bacteroidota bacterium]|nr:WYL domain-containing protein [Bacteroidota bacterium]